MSAIDQGDGQRITPAGRQNTLYRLGGVSVLLTLTFYVSQFVLIRWDQSPASTEEWFALFERSRLVGLFYLNALVILSITLLGVMLLPSLATPLMIASGLFWMPWWLLVGLGLLRLARLDERDKSA